MKKKNKNSIEAASAVVNNLKATEETLQQKSQDTITIKTIETSVRKIEKFKKEILALKEKLRNKKSDLNQEKEVMWELVRTAKKALKSKTESIVNHEKIEKSEINEKSGKKAKKN